MPAPENLSGGIACDLAERWIVHPTIMERAVRAADQFTRETGHVVRIISGYRSEAKQRQLRSEGRPAASDALSTHRSCPATGVDVNIGPYSAALTPRVLRVTWGRIVTEQGLRWGGGSKPDSGGVPSDWNHVDGGPRSQTGVLPLPPVGVPPTTAGPTLIPSSAGPVLSTNPCPAGKRFLGSDRCMKRVLSGKPPYRDCCF